MASHVSYILDICASFHAEKTSPVVRVEPSHIADQRLPAHGDVVLAASDTRGDLPLLWRGPIIAPLGTGPRNIRYFPQDID